MSIPYSFESEKQAKTTGKQKLNLLNNKKGWRVVVWENLGWHMSLVKGNLHLHYSRPDDDFHAFLSENCYGGDSMFWSSNFNHKDPNKVIEHKIKTAQAFIDGCQKIVDALK